ncbi:hypothetical protein LIER_15642 [Lithospermum erythrorhizon]|uniref:Uncharacterized protein n=1 Tax=Lithospermum erythrorhizon TaxID=34254 RepID=A0AAV3Q3R1_LITER
MDIETHPESSASHHSGSTLSTSISTTASGASSPHPEPSILDKGILITASLTRVDVTPFHTFIKEVEDDGWYSNCSSSALTRS